MAGSPTGEIAGEKANSLPKIPTTSRTLTRFISYIIVFIILNMLA
jgi:hypothetical protein